MGLDMESRYMPVNGRKSNYEIQCEMAQKKFCQLDHEKMIKKFALPKEGNCVYFNYVNHRYQINLENGMVYYSDNGKVCCSESKNSGCEVLGSELSGNGIYNNETYNKKAGFDEIMAIFDVLCESKENLTLSGEWAIAQSLDYNVHYGNGTGIDMYAGYTNAFEGRMEELKTACEKLGGKPSKYADISYEIPVFDFMNVIFEFWDSDEEFPAKVQILWDKKVLDYVKFETTYYIAGHLMQQIQENM